MSLYAQVACELPRDPKMIIAGWQARAVYVEGLLYARENLTDGVLLSVALPLWMPDMTAKTRSKHLQRLVEVGALEQIEGGWRYPEHVWRKWNPTRSEVEEKREAERQRKADYRERKKRERQSSARVPLGQVVAGTSRDRQPKPEPKKSQSHSQSHSHSSPPPPSNSSTWTPEWLAGEMGLAYARDQKDQGRDVRSVEKLGEWKCNELLADRPRLERLCALNDEYRQASGGDTISINSICRSWIVGDDLALYGYHQDIERWRIEREEQAS